MANFDINHWHQIYHGDDANDGQSMAGTSLYSNETSGAIFFTETNTTNSQQQWQIFPYNSSYYVLRTKDCGAQGYMTVKVSDDAATPGNTVPLTKNASIADVSMFWQIDPWGDGTFFFTNAANGSAWHLGIKSNSLMSMSSNITAPQDGQRFSFKQLEKIDNASFSSVIAPVRTAAVTSTGTPSSTASVSPSASSSSSSGLSTGAKAGIGAGVGIAGLIALLALGFFFLRRRGAHSQPKFEEATPPYEPVPEAQPYETNKAKELHHEPLDHQPQQRGELESTNVQRAQELPNSEFTQYVELPAWNK